MSFNQIRKAGGTHEDVRDMDAIRTAVSVFGAVLLENVAADRGYRRYYQNETPPGFKSLEELNKSCRHVVCLKDKKAYEIGLLESREFPGSYDLAYDSYDGKLEAVFGKNLSRFYARCKIEEMRNKARSLGHAFTEAQLPDGRIVCKAFLPQMDKPRLAARL